MPSPRPIRAVTAAVLLVMTGSLVLGEWLGWPFLEAPLQRLLSEHLDRRVSLSADTAVDTALAARSAPASPPASAPTSTPVTGFQIRFLGGVTVHAPRLEIAAPAWSQAPHLVQARDVVLDLRYADLWRAYRGQSLHIHSLQASAMDSRLERLADGRVSWQFKPPPAPPPDPPSFGQLRVDSGTLRWQDAMSATDIDARMSLTAPAPGAPGAPGTPQTAGSRLRADATGHYRSSPIKLELQSTGVMPWLAEAGQRERLPLTLRASVGRARLSFNGSAVDALKLHGLAGHFSLSGPSLAAVGDPLGVTLPTTSSFSSQGVIVKDGPTWSVRLDDATVGASRLSGAFTYQTGGSVPLLSGRLGGSRLLLTDLGPVIGKPVGTPVGTPVGKTGAKTAASATPAPAPPSTRTKPSAQRRVLPDRPFDLVALRKMDANVLIDIAEVDLNSALLEPLRPLRGHLQLTGGVLNLRELDARTGQGQLRGDLTLDGRTDLALWTADLRWDGIRLERSIHQRSRPELPAYVTGRLAGRSTLAGQGRSTAEILSSLKGQAHTELHEGSVSHLAIEVAGLDVAQSLGVVVKGDRRLQVSCAVADLVAERGVFRPRVMVVDTSDSAVWIDGTLSLATETLDLRALVAPKDFSPLTLRTPVSVTGSFADPVVSLDKAKMGGKLAAAFLLGLVNPLAALLPLLDPGDADAARRAAAGCQALTQRGPSQSANSRRFPLQASPKT